MPYVHIVVPGTSRINVMVVPTVPEKLQIGNLEYRDLVYDRSRCGGCGTGEAFINVDCSGTNMIGLKSSRLPSGSS